MIVILQTLIFWDRLKMSVLQNYKQMKYKEVKKLIVSLLLITFSLNIFGQNNDLPNYIRQQYPDSLNKLIEIVLKKEKPDDSLLFYCFPLNDLESRLLFNIDYRKEEKYCGVYHKISNYWINKCIYGDDKFILKFIRLSEFVDGYFATDYFSDIELIIDKIGAKFCEVLEESPIEHKRRLLLYDYVIEKCAIKQ